MGFDLSYDFALRQWDANLRFVCGIGPALCAEEKQVMENLRGVLEKYGFRFKKQLGQNFLSDANLLRSVADGAGTDGKTVPWLLWGGGRQPPTK